MRIFSYLFAGTFILLVSCGKIPDTIVMPEWNSDLNLPVTNRAYQLSDLIKTDKYISIDTTGNGLLYRIISDTIVSSTSVEEFIMNQVNTDQYSTTVPVGNYTGNGYLPLSNGASLDSAVLKAGVIHFEIQNNSMANTGFTMTLPDLTEIKSGKSFSLSGMLNANGGFSTDMNLNGFAYSGRNVSDKSKIRLLLSTTSNDSTLKGTAGINIKIDKSNLAYISGIIPPKELPPVTRAIALPAHDEVLQFRNKAQLFDSRLIINAKYLSSVNQPFEVLLKNVRIQGKNLDGSYIFLKNANGNDNLGDYYITGGQFNLEFTNSNSNIASVISFLPDSLILSSQVVMNPNDKYGVATDRDSVKMNAFFSATSELAFDSLSYSDTLNLEMSEDNRLKIRDANSLRIVNELTNGLPLESNLSFTFADVSGKPLFTKETIVKGASAYDAQNNLIPEFSKVTFDLDSLEINQFSKAYKIITRIKASTSPDIKIPVLKPDARLKILSYCELNYHLKP